MLKYIKSYAASIEGINIYPIVSLLIFVLFFIGVIYYVNKMDKHSVAKLKNLPLDLEEETSLSPSTVKQA